MNLENYLQRTAPALTQMFHLRSVTSPLKRGGRDGTARPGDREVPIVPDKRIQEMSFGEFEGLCCREEGWNIPDPGFRNFLMHRKCNSRQKGGGIL